MPIFRKLNHFLKLAVVAAIIPLGSGASAQEPAFSLSSPDLTNGQFENALYCQRLRLHWRQHLP